MQIIQSCLFFIDYYSMVQIYPLNFIKNHFTNFIMMIITSSVDLVLMLMIIEERIIIIHLFIYVKFHFQSQVKLFTFYEFQLLMEINKYLLDYYFLLIVLSYFHFILIEKFVFHQMNFYNFDFTELNFEFKFLNLTLLLIILKKHQEYLLAYLKESCQIMVFIQFHDVVE